MTNQIHKKKATKIFKVYENSVPQRTMDKDIIKKIRFNYQHSKSHQSIQIFISFMFIELISMGFITNGFTLQNII